MFYLFLIIFIFLIVRRPWPNFVCKGRHTSSVVLYWYCIIGTKWREIDNIDGNSRVG